MHNILELLRTVDCDQLLSEEIEAAADEIERLRAENAKLTKALAVYRAMMWPATKDENETIGEDQYQMDLPKQALGG